MAQSWPSVHGAGGICSDAALEAALGLALARRARRPPTAPQPPFHTHEGVEPCCARFHRNQEAAALRLRALSPTRPGSPAPGTSMAAPGRRQLSPSPPCTPRATGATPGRPRSAGRRCSPARTDSSVFGAGAGGSSSSSAYPPHSACEGAIPDELVDSGGEGGAQTGDVGLNLVAVPPVVARVLAEATDVVHERAITLMGVGHPHFQRLRVQVDQQIGWVGQVLSRGLDVARILVGWRAAARSNQLWLRFCATSDQLCRCHRRLSLGEAAVKDTAAARDMASVRARREERRRNTALLAAGRVVAAASQTAALGTCFSAWRFHSERIRFVAHVGEVLGHRTAATATANLVGDCFRHWAASGWHRRNRAARQSRREQSRRAIQSFVTKTQLSVAALRRACCFAAWGNATHKARCAAAFGHAEAKGVAAEFASSALAAGRNCFLRSLASSRQMRLRLQLLAWAMSASRSQQHGGLKAMETLRTHAKEQLMRRLGAETVALCGRYCSAWICGVVQARAKAVETKAASLWRSKNLKHLSCWALLSPSTARGLASLVCLLTWRSTVPADVRRPLSSRGGKLGAAAAAARTEGQVAGEPCPRGAPGPSPAALGAYDQINVGGERVLIRGPVTCSVDAEAIWRREVQRRKTVEQAARAGVAGPGYEEYACRGATPDEPLRGAALFNLASHASASEAGYQELFEYHKRQARAARGRCVGGGRS